MGQHVVLHQKDNSMSWSKEAICELVVLYTALIKLSRRCMVQHGTWSKKLGAVFFFHFYL